jgi:hypothetical protein
LWAASAAFTERNSCAARAAKGFPANQNREAKMANENMIGSRAGESSPQNKQAHGEREESRPRAENMKSTVTAVAQDYTGKASEATPEGATIGAVSFKRAQVAICAAVLVLVLPVSSLLAQLPSFTGQKLTGSLTADGTVNVNELAETTASTAPAARSGIDVNPHLRPVLRPPVRDAGPLIDRAPSTPLAETLAAIQQLNFRGFNGLTHLDQRTARNGNQFSTEPPDQGLAIGNGFVLEAVNSALNVYDTSGVQQLVRPVALSQFFGLPAGVNRTTGTFGVFPGDPSATFDPETQRWFVIAWAQLNTSAGAPLLQSRLYIAVSQSSDPTGTYTIYTLNTTAAHAPDAGGPRVPDFPHFAVDHYGVYISTNEFGIDPTTGGPGPFITAAITAISKQALISGSSGPAPAIVRFPLPFESGYEFTVWPASPSPDTGPVLANGGTQYFVSSHFVMTTEHTLAVWALTNTSSLNSTNPALNLQAVVVNTQAYHFPTTAARQKPGFRPLGESLGEPLERLDPGDYRIVSANYSAGRLWATLDSEVIDAQGVKRHVANYFAIAPQIQGKFLTATLITQGRIAPIGANALYPAIAVNARQQGGMVFTLVGPNNYPSSAFVPINNTTAGAIQISRAGNEPEDGFTGYRAFGGNGVARWGDYSAAAVDSDGSIWMATEYTPDLARTVNANWSTYITRYHP